MGTFSKRVGTKTIIILSYKWKRVKEKICCEQRRVIRDCPHLPELCENFKTTVEFPLELLGV
jgi:hypothetical protein